MRQPARRILLTSADQLEPGSYTEIKATIAHALVPAKAKKRSRALPAAIMRALPPRAMR